MEGYFESDRQQDEARQALECLEISGKGAKPSKKYKKPKGKTR